MNHLKNPTSYYQLPNQKEYGLYLKKILLQKLFLVFTGVLRITEMVADICQIIT